MKEITRDTLITGARIQSRSGRAVVIDLRQGALEEMGGGRRLCSRALRAQPRRTAHDPFQGGAQVRTSERRL